LAFHNLPDETFLSHLRDRLPEDLSDFHAGDLYLACACANGNRRALKLFVEHFLKELRITLAPINTTDAFVDEVQQLMERLLVPDAQGRLRIEQYSGKGPLKSWVRAAALRTALNLHRTTRRQATRDGDLLEVKIRAKSKS
jgi:RNA polymerase sigma-70 factor, ECF subfamily